jgi:hypothetical protein
VIPVAGESALTKGNRTRVGLGAVVWDMIES